MELQEGSLVLCTVERIEPTIVFVKLPDNRQGTIVTSEIAAGRIKNIRKYVMPNKKIVCKVLSIDKNIHLSLRRVSSKEKQEVLAKYKKEQTAKSALHSVLKEQSSNIEENILKDFESLAQFLEQVKEKPEIINKYIPKQHQEAIKKIAEKKRKTAAE
ncbi:MAG: hypothetical protein ACP5D2_03885, partial [Candidatus Nanoarchaeia archaeon]